VKRANTREAQAPKPSCGFSGLSREANGSHWPSLVW